MLQRRSRPLELDHLSLPLLFTSDFEVFASLDGELLPKLAFGAFHPENDLLGGLGLLPEDGLSLSSETLLFPVVPSLSLSKQGFLSLLVLGYLVDSVLKALAFAERPSTLGDVHHRERGRWRG